MRDNNSTNKNKILWSLLFVLIAVLTVWTITSQSKDFSFSGFLDFLSTLDPIYAILAFAAMLMFIIFEGLAILTIIRSFGYKRGFFKGFSYSAADIYFSAITPSATGGQPASALLMMRDGIPGPVVTVALLTNLVMYTFAILIIGLVSFILRPAMFLEFSLLSQILIMIGVVCQIVIALVFILLLKKDRILFKICSGALRILARLHIIKNLDAKVEKLDGSIREYHSYVSQLKGKQSMLFRALLYNIIQRASLVCVTLFAFLASGGNPGLSVDMFVVKCMVILGSNTVPIPGAMGVIDYLLLDAFGGFVDSVTSVNLELLARTVSFYFCVLLCGIVFIVRLISMQITKRKK